MIVLAIWFDNIATLTISAICVTYRGSFSKVTKSFVSYYEKLFGNFVQRERETVIDVVLLLFRLCVVVVSWSRKFTFLNNFHIVFPNIRSSYPIRCASSIQVY